MSAEWLADIIKLNRKTTMITTITYIFINWERKRRKQYYGTDRSYVTKKSEVLNMFESAKVADSLKLAAS